MTAAIPSAPQTHAYFDRMAATLLDPAAPAPAALRAHADRSDEGVARRLDVHRNNVAHGLARLLADSFPVVEQLVGAEFFEAMAVEHVRQQPPRSPLLFDYGAGFADWIEGFEPVRSLPYLPDVARLEWMRQCASHAADVAVPSPAELAAPLSQPAQLPGLRALLHPSLALLRSEFGAVSIWAAHQRCNTEVEVELQGIDWHQPEAALTLRDATDCVLTLPLSGADAGFVAALADGQALGDALQRAGEGVQLAPLLSLLIRHGALVGWAAVADADAVAPGAST